MIKLTNVDKYFNKGKINEIHVINDTSLRFPKTGLITLLGDSGSGKTTLLNVIGGLDTAKGNISFNDVDIPFKKTKEWDKLRVSSIGYIFQNYYLLDNLTVYENIEIVLTMIGVTDQKEIEDRVNYVLKSVGMERFKNRAATDLSSGQKQRVAIARAIVKNPDVVIADEPTGNLDSNNSIEVLKIIKEISKEKLVILVTHNKSLAYAYSDRIINIVDGQVVSDEDDIKTDEKIDYIDSNIYLKDLESLKSNNINIYTNEDISNLDLTLVKINNNYYLKTNDKNITIQLLNETSNIKLVDKHKKETEETFITETSFELSYLNTDHLQKQKGHVYSVKDSLIQAFKRLTTLSRKGKLQIVALILLGLMFATSFALFTSTILLDESLVNGDKEVYREDRNYGFVNRDLLKDLDFTIYGSFSIYIAKGNFKEPLVGINLAPKDIIGKEGTDKYDVYVDETLLNDDFNYKYILNAFGITKKEHFMSNDFYIQSVKFNIKDTVNTNTKTIYVDKDILFEIYGTEQRYGTYRLATEDLEINESLIPPVGDSKYKIYVSEQYYGDENTIINRFLQNFNVKPEILGYYIDETVDTYYVVYFEKESFKTFLSYEQYYSNLNYYFDNYETVPDGFISIYDYNYRELKELKAATFYSSIAQSLISLAIGVLIFYLLVRSSLTERRKEISILRSLGLSKNEVRKLFIIEYIITLTLTSLVGVLMGYIFAKMFAKSPISELFSIRVNIVTLALTIVIMYAVKLLVLLIPINKILKKPPAQLLKEYDI